MKAPGITARQLVKDGKWIVPQEERPRNWRDILPDVQDALAEAMTATEDIERRKSLVIELRDVAVQSAEWAGAGTEIRDAGIVILAGVAMRDPHRLNEWLGIEESFIEMVGGWAIRHEVWRRDGGIMICDEEIQEGFEDLGLWMLAMAAVGQIDYCGNCVFKKAGQTL